MAIAQHRDIYAQASFSVALVEEFLHYASCPLQGDVELASWVPNIDSVDNSSKHCSLVLATELSILLRQQRDFCNIFHYLSMLGHVGSQDVVYDKLS